HFYLTREIDAAELLSLKRALAAASAKRGGPEISLTDLLLKALALAIAAHPAVNAFWQEGRAVPHSAIALGLAVALEEGLIVPVLRQPDRLSLTGLARQRAGLVERARAGRLAPDDFGGASATLSNLGMFGVDHFQAILNPPESLILAAGRIRDRVVAVNGAPAVRPTLHATLTADHRVVDGAQAARLLAAFAEALENPGLLILPEA
ncbi:MAG: 2-oxo acid dehydrogenase subunit E2, partial [Acidobacteria bacterium]|nr:2-oxo acid dehydrogenase subunit E2 [Acidobacteriota bacterium]